MKRIVSLLLLAISIISKGQSVSNTSTNTVQAKAVLVITKPSVTANSNYRLLNSQPGNANAWLQFYTWAQKSKEDKTVLQQTIQSAQHYIGQSWQYSLMQFIASGKKDFDAINHAIENSDNKAMVYPYAIHYAIIHNDHKLLKEYSVALNNLAPLSPALYEYHYNVLISASPNATIYGKGLTDLAPMAVLQQVYGIRTDVELKYYEEKIQDTKNVYICLSAGKEIIESYPGAGYSGLLIGLSAATGIHELQKRVEHFSLEKLNAATTLSEEETGFYKNYIPSFLLVYKWHKGNGHTTAAERWKNNLQKLGTLTGTTTAIEKAIAD